MKVLVIEDDPVTLVLLAHIVKSAGYAVLTARDGGEALAAIRLERPDLILADINLPAKASGPEWDGFNVLEWMNHHYPHHRTRYIVVSSGDPLKLNERVAAVGAFGFVVKPIQKSLLLSEIRRAIGDPPESAGT